MAKRILYDTDDKHFVIVIGIPQRAFGPFQWDAIQPFVDRNQLKGYVILEIEFPK